METRLPRREIRQFRTGFGLPGVEVIDVEFGGNRHPFPATLHPAEGEDGQLTLGAKRPGDKEVQPLKFPSAVYGFLDGGRGLVSITPAEGGDEVIMEVKNFPDPGPEAA